MLTLLRRSSTTVVSHHASVSEVLLPLLRDVPHVVHFHGPWAQEARVEGAPRWKTWLQQRQEARVYRSADRILTLSHAFKELVVRDYGVDERRVRVVPGAIEALDADPGISRHEARTRLGWPTDRPILLSIRRLVRRVGVDVLVQAAAKMVRQHPDLLILIGGSGPLKTQLAESIERYGLENNVRLLGFVPAGDLSIAYRAADFSIVPTQSLEGFGLVTLESMAAGTPAIVTPVGSLPEVIGPLSESLILPSKSAEGIAEGLDAILRGRVALPDDQACRTFVRQNHDWSVIAPRVLDVYRAASQP
jgi:glycosyltransferase involved in cell wall biosynthesis